VAFPDSGDEHNTVVVEGESRVQHDNNVTKKSDLIKGVVGRCWEVCHHSPGKVRAAVVLGWGCWKLVRGIYFARTSFGCAG